MLNPGVVSSVLIHIRALHGQNNVRGKVISYMIVVKGSLNWLNFKGKTNRLKVPLQNVYFLLFWLISCISLVFLIEIWSFCSNLLGNYPAHKIDQLPLLRILSLCMDHSMLTRINSLYLFLLFLFTPLALPGQNDVRINALVWQ